MGFKSVDTNEYIGAYSLRGESHRATHTRNQDAYIAKKSRYGVTLAVADGVGSQTYSQIGSRAIVKAVARAFRLYETNRIPVSEITATAFALYKKTVPVSKRGQASTTCVFAHISEKNGLFVGQVGDGVCYLKLNGRFYVMQGKDAEFSNVVLPLCAEWDEARWKTRHFALTDSSAIQIMLATDGVSDDIISGKEEECLDFYVSKIQGSDVAKGKKTVKSILQNWNVPGSRDDKTMIVYSRG